MLAPAMIAVGISSIVVGNSTIYTGQVNTRADSPAHRLQLSFPLLSTLSVRRAMTRISIQFSSRQTMAEAESLLAGSVESGGPVLDAKGNLQGVLTLADVHRVPLAARSVRSVGEVMNKDILTVYPDETLDEALEQLTNHRVSWSPVVDIEATREGKHVVGLLSASDIVRVYRETLVKDSRRMRGLVEGTVMVEARIEPGMQLAGRPLRQTHLPKETLVVSIRRQNELLFPRGSAVIEPGDTVTFLVSPQGEELLQKYLAIREMQPSPV